MISQNLATRSTVFGPQGTVCVQPFRFVGLIRGGGRRLNAEDWPTFRHDVTRSGITRESLAWPLAECWTFQAPHAPRPAWGDPKVGPVEDILELRRVHFDDVFQTVGGNDALYFGSSADHKLYCLELATGVLRWSKSTGGPIRLAPTLSEGRVYVGSDDGYVYCCDARLGDEIWRFRAARKTVVCSGMAR